MRQYITPEDYVIAEQNGIKKKTLYNRVYCLGIPVDEAITRPTGYLEPKGIWAEWKELAEQNGVKPRTFYSRVRRGKTPRQAATKPVQPNCLIPPDIAQRAKENGINVHVLSQRIHQYHWNHERACTEPVGKRGGYRRQSKKDEGWV